MPARRNRLQRPATYPGQVQRPSREAEGFVVKGIHSEPQGRAEGNRQQRPAALIEIDRSVYL